MLKYPYYAKMAEKTKKNYIFFVKLFDIYKNCCIFAKIFGYTDKLIKRLII